MKTVTIAESEYLKMRLMIEALQHQLALVQDKDFMQKLHVAYHFFFPAGSTTNALHPVSLKRGSGKNIIAYIADDFTAPLDDFKDYM